MSFGRSWTRNAAGESELDAAFSGAALYVRMVSGDRYARFCHKLNSLWTWPPFGKNLILKFLTQL